MRFTELFPRVGEICGRDSEKGGWLISPLQHLIEGQLTLLAAVLLIIYGYTQFKKELRVKAAQSNKKDDDFTVTSQYHTPRPSLASRLLNSLLFVLLLSSLLLIINHKIYGNKLPFLLQPCHVLHTTLLVLFFLPNERPDSIGNIIFNIYLHCFWGPLVGWIAADKTCYKQYLEHENFAFQHALLLLVPLVWVYQRRFVIHKGRNMFLLAFNLLLSWHFIVLLPVSLLTGSNVNFLLCPPRTVPPIVAFGAYYRAPTTLGCAFLAWLLRYVVLEGVIASILGKDGVKEGGEEKRINTAEVIPDDIIQEEQANGKDDDTLQRRKNQTTSD